jgi:hypothetical protein
MPQEDHCYASNGNMKLKAAEYVHQNQEQIAGCIVFAINQFPYPLIVAYTTSVFR